MMRRLLKTKFKKYPLLNKNFFLLTIFLFFGFTSVIAQSFEIKGKVSDFLTKEALPGVNITIEGTTIGTITGLSGEYTILVNAPNATLVYSFMGYANKMVQVNSNSVINIELEEATTVVEEVVAIGYGTSRKKDLTGSVVSVKGQDLQVIPVSSAIEAMSGKVAGVQITTTEGSPDAQIMIRVRGGGSITQDNSPLFIVDGFPVSSISDIPASSIVSIDVLKDASSTAIYGSRGANGVVIITTKSGSEGKISVAYNAYYGFKKVANKLNNQSVSDYVNWQYEYALLTDDLSGYEKYFGLYQDIDLYNNQPANDWYNQVFGLTGTTFNHDLSINGGSDKFKYSFIYSGMKNTEIMLGSNFNRNNVNLKLDNKPNHKVNLSFSLRYSDAKINGAGAIDQNTATPNDARVKQSMIFSPIPLNGLGDYSDEEFASSFTNPIENVYDNDRTQNRNILNLSGSLNLELIKDLNFKTEIGLDNSQNTDNRFYGLTTYYVKNTPAATYQNMPASILSDYIRTGLRNTNTVNYNFKNVWKNQNHHLKVLVGQEIFFNQSNNLISTIHGYPTFFGSDEAFRLTTQGVAQSINNSYNPDDKLVSFFGRANYDYKGIYLLTATYRADGSSKFSKGNQWGYFPSVAAAWRISDEKFMSSLTPVLDNLKLRVSYGSAGNNNIPSGQINQSFVSSVTTYLNGVTSIWTPSTIMANPDLKWETTVTRNLALDYGLFKSRISGSVELYYNTTNDLLINFPVSGTGYTTQYRNMGETENKGIDISLNVVAIDKKNYGLNFDFNIGMNQNKIVSLGIMEDFGQASSWASTEIGDDYWIATGGSVGEMYGYVSDGRYEVSDFQAYDETADVWILNEGVADNKAIIGKVRPGSLKLKDLNGDTLVTSDDRKVIGNANPMSTGGFNINARFYGFDLSASLIWSYGNDIYNANKIEYTTSRYQFRNLSEMMGSDNRWTNIDENGNLVNDPAILQTMNEGTTMWSPYMTRHVFHSWAVEDGSFLKLKSVSLGYTLPNTLLKKVHIQNLRVYVTGYNLFTLTNYSGFDPEVSTRRATALTPGVDYSAYPKSRQLIFGLNLNF